MPNDQGLDPFAPSPRLVNLTPHALTICWDGGSVSLPSQGSARVDDAAEGEGHLAGVPITRVHPGRVSGLPAAEPGTFYVVSRLVAQSLVERQDLLFPFDEIRDGDGRIVGVRSLGRF